MYIALTGRVGLGELSTQPVRLFEAGIERPRAGCPCHGIGQLALPRFCAGRDVGGTGYDPSIHLPEEPKNFGQIRLKPLIWVRCPCCRRKIIGHGLQLGWFD